MPPELEWRSQRVPFDDIGLHRNDGSSDLVEQRSCTRVVGSIRSLECRNRERSGPLPAHERPVLAHGVTLERASQGSQPESPAPYPIVAPCGTAPRSPLPAPLIP